MTEWGSQSDLVAYLSRASSYGQATGPVDHIVTHISHVFLTGDHAYKLKRAVHLAYADFTTLEARRTACAAELALNRRTAPSIYERLLPVTRAADGAFALDGAGEIVDWLVMMRRFDQEQLLERLALRGQLSMELARALGDTIAEFHAEAEPCPKAGGAQAFTSVIDGLADAFRACPRGVFDATEIDRFLQLCRAALNRVGALLNRRRDAGKVRRCHGDLHLRNICLLDGRPVLFDCIEFSPTLATIDVLYDLAFLLMDLESRGLDAAANAALNRYLDRVDEDDGMAAMPLFMAVRAAIRAHVTASTETLTDGRSQARRYFECALRVLSPAAPRLIAIGGLSGTGKSTLAYEVAPKIGGAAGSRVLRSDVIRKRLFGLEPETRLGPEAYRADVTAQVYAHLMDEAARLLSGRRSVIVDAVFARPEERAAIRQVAQAAGAPFDGLWLEAPAKTLETRIAARRDDASDADTTVLHRQLNFNCGPIDWSRLESSATAGAVTAAGLKLLG